MNLRTANVLLGLALIALAIFVFLESQSFSDRSAELPHLLSAMFLLVAAILLWANLNPKTGALRARVHPFAGVPWKLWTGTVIALVLLGLGSSYIGFYESAFLFLLVTTWLMSVGEPMGTRRFVAPLLWAVGFDVFLYVTFNMILHIPTPPGILV